MKTTTSPTTIASTSTIITTATTASTTTEYLMKHTQKFSPLDAKSRLTHESLKTANNSSKKFSKETKSPDFLPKEKATNKKNSSLSDPIIKSTLELAKRKEIYIRPETVETNFIPVTDDKVDSGKWKGVLERELPL